MLWMWIKLNTSGSIDHLMPWHFISYFYWCKDILRLANYKHTNWICRKTMNLMSRTHSTQYRLPVKWKKKWPLHIAHRLKHETQTSTICLNIRTSTFEPKTEYSNQLEENYWAKDVIWKNSGHRFFQQPTNFIKNCSKNHRKWIKKIFKPHSFDLLDFGKLKVLPQ